MQKQNSTNSQENNETEVLHKDEDEVPKVKSSGSQDSETLFKTPQDLSEENKESKGSDEEKADKPSAKQELHQMMLPETQQKICK